MISGASRFKLISDRTVAMEAQASTPPPQGQKQQLFDIKGDGNVANFKLIMGLVLGIGLSVILLIMVGVCVIFWRLRRAPEDNFVVVCESTPGDGEDKKLRSSQKQLPELETKKQLSSPRDEKSKLSKDTLLHELKFISMNRGIFKGGRKGTAQSQKNKFPNVTTPDDCEFQDLETGNLPCPDFYKADCSNYQVLLDRKETLRSISRGDIQVFSLKYLQIATNGFAERNQISERSFCRVYKGFLIAGEPVAVEVLYCGGKMNSEHFRKHVVTLSKLQSPYLVRLLGYCADGDERLLVTEYMPRGSLRDQLHGSSILHRHALSWQRRLHVAYCVAQGLVYLHETVEPPVCHTDLESGNIMLDSSYNAKLVDFCVTTLLEVETGRNMSNNVLGSFTYQAPEFRANGVRNTKSDVFSFGVVMLELLTGRKPIDTDRPKGQQSLVSWVLPQLEHPKELQTMVDPPLKFNGVVEADSFLEFAQIAGRCLEYDAQERPPMSEVLKLLTRLIAKHVACQASSSGSVDSSDSVATLDDGHQMATKNGKADLPGYVRTEKCKMVTSESDTSDPSSTSPCPSAPNISNTAQTLETSESNSATGTPALLKVSGNLAGRRKAQKGPEGGKHWTCNQERSPCRPAIPRPSTGGF